MTKHQPNLAYVINIAKNKPSLVDLTKNQPS